MWDLPLRLFHWLLVATLAGSWLTQELGVQYMDWHIRLGYLAIGLVVFRLLWGFLGPRHARFSSFLHSPGAALHYARSWASGTVPVWAGHNPLGAWAVCAMLLLTAVQGASGLFNSDDILWSGPWHAAVPTAFADRMSWLHDFNFKLLLGLAGLHLAAIAAYWLRLRIDLVTAMITGRKRHLNEADGIRTQRLWCAIALAVFAALVVWLIVALAPEPVPADALF